MLDSGKIFSYFFFFLDSATLHFKNQTKSLKNHLTLFSEFRMEMVRSAFDFASNMGWGKPAQVRWFCFSLRSLR